MIPVIDLFNRPSQLAAEMKEAGEMTGIFLLDGHHIDLRKFHRVTTEFFRQPAHIKAEVAMTADYPYGYSGVQQEALNQANPDLKESFCIGPVQEVRHYPAWPDMIGPWSKAYQDFSELSMRLLWIMAQSLHLPENYFQAFIGQHASALRALSYPKATGAAGSHTDYGLFTILHTPQPGLQAQLLDGSWVDVLADPNLLVVNLGDMMARWTNDHWVAAPHRVRPIEEPRQSVAFFFNPDLKAVIKCLPGFGVHKYEPVEAGTYLMERHRAATK